jgi:hypothetical protein
MMWFSIHKLGVLLVRSASMVSYIKLIILYCLYVFWFFVSSILLAKFESKGSFLGKGKSRTVRCFVTIFNFSFSDVCCSNAALLLQSHCL